MLLPDGLEPAALEELVEAAHKGGLRALLEVAAPSAEANAILERYALDGLVGAPIDPALLRRFPATRAFEVDASASKKLADNLSGTPLPLAALTGGDGLVEAHGAIGLGLLLLARRGALIDGSAFPLLGIRRRHKALRERHVHRARRR